MKPKTKKINNPIYLVFKKIFFKFMSKKILLKIIYKKIFDKKLNLKNPQTLNEKIQWKKIYDKKEIYQICSDKYAVRNYVKEKIGEEYLIPLLYQTDNPKKINFDKIPLPFIIKSNHGSGQNIIIKTKEDINEKEILKKGKKWLKTNYYSGGLEPQYKNIKPKIIVEKLLLGEKGQIPEDYKFHCFNGKAEFISFHLDRFGDHKTGEFDTKWNLLPFSWACHGIKKIKENLPKPKNLKRMIKIAEKLSEDFDYVRVDLYSVKEKIYFGELTFSHGAGFVPIRPEKYDLIFGKKIKLQKKIYNP